MTAAGVGLTAASVAAGLAMVAAIAAPRRLRVAAVGGLTAASAAAGLVAALAVLTGSGTVAATMPDLLPLAGVRIELDALGAVFVVAVAVVAIPAALYGIGYAAPRSTGHGASGRSVQATLPLFVWSLLMVPAAGSVSTLLVLWELMALSSLLLVVADHRHNPAVRSAAHWYAAMTQLGLVAILLALVVLAGQAGGDSFAAIRDGAAGVGPHARSVVFVLALVGFGSKAGVVPLHVWLPRAHPEAPSHVSALMSGAMVKLGVYGIVRVGWDLLGGGPRWWGLTILVVGAVSALFGILHALVATDLKRLLAYSTTENVGLILIGVGAAGLFAASGNRALASVAVAAALLHVVNHAAFKGLLFLGAGSVLHATGTRDLDRLGGLARRMPVTGATFAIGALAIAALPPLNGFVSEWLLLQALVHSLPSSTALVAVAMPVAVAIVALTGGLAAATFVKAFGTGFLAMPRSPEADAAHESPWSMRIGLCLLAGVCVALGLAPTALGRPLTRAVAVLGPLADGRPVRADGVNLELAGIQATLSPLLLAVGLLAAIFATLAVVRAVRSAPTRRGAATWGCGRSVQTARMEYTATSFAEPLQRVFDDVLRPDLDVHVDHRVESRYYVEAVRYRQGIRDAVEHRLYEPVLRAGRWWGRTARHLQDGSIHRYLAYIMVALVVALVVAR
ncbi:MAG TPA: proton-conducting transporter membrane subunit [Ilumatobacteraceae bacterium]|nr:proton-conducting transporter membrane subunit [Ilumatobacteraceae bacterium]